MIRNSDWSETTFAFEARSLDPEACHHADHVRVAFDLLRAYNFIDASAKYAKGIQDITEKAAAPHKFNLTITYAFMSLIAERLANAPDCGFDEFVSGNPDLMSKEVLSKWYRNERLHSKEARRLFLLPEIG